jgi:carboxylate-amine ligase
VRPSARYETLEFRVTDVCMTVDEAVMVAGLVRALTRTCALEAERHVEIRHVHPEILSAAKWQAARFGLDDHLIDTQERRAVPALALIEKFLTHLRPVLEEHSEWDEIYSLVRDVIERGTGATRQREVYARSGDLEDVVDFIVAETTKGTGGSQRQATAS